nr:mating-type m-specific polypeptide mc [Quercus suber]
MASKSTQSAPDSLQPSGISVLKGFLDAVELVQKQLRDGKLQAVLPITKVSILGVDGLGATNTELDFIFNADSNSITVTPIGPMPATVSIPLTSTTLSTTTKAVTSKVPRPPNAFIIYRKEWHSIVAKENRSLHNNDISVMLGRKWHNESEAVKDIYRQKAEDAKRQHAAIHPEYHYQPRKTSEKKRRMTKKKLANLAAQAKTIDVNPPNQQEDLPAEFDPYDFLDESLEQIIQPFDINNYGTVWYDEPPMLRGIDEDEQLAQQLNSWNAQYSTVAQFGPVVGIPTANGKTVGQHERIAIPGAEAYQPRPSASMSPVAPPTIQSNSRLPFAGVVRQDRLEVLMNDLADSNNSNNCSRSSTGSG